jgi:hypothetical protein
MLEIHPPKPPIIGGRQSYVPRYLQVDFDQFSALGRMKTTGRELE